jgi:SAM-dependent methyltransferase
MTDWLSEDEPFDLELSRAQVEGVLMALGDSPRRVLELGCGSGRVLEPVARAGHHVVGIDRVGEVLSRCRDRCEGMDDRVRLIRADFLREAWNDLLGDEAGHRGDEARFDAILLLGNTLMTLTDLDQSVTLFRRVSEHLAPGGVFLIDDLPGCFWPELTEGNWQSGLTEDGQMQLIWHRRDTIFTIRMGEAVDADSWVLKPDDRRFRLWTSSLLSMVAQRAGLSEPRTTEDHVLTEMQAISLP